MPGIPHDLRAGYGGLSPVAAICHRTYGGWGGDYSVGKGSRGVISFHFLVGKEAGQWVQFVDTNRVAYHAKGANGWSIGIEVTGTNEDDFTGWQLEKVGEIVRWIHDTHRIPLVYVDADRAGQRAGFVAHNAVAGSSHTDRWGANWDRLPLQQEMFTMGQFETIMQRLDAIEARLAREHTRTQDRIEARYRKLREGDKAQTEELLAGQHRIKQVVREVAGVDPINPISPNS